MTKTAILVTTFLRDTLLFRCIESIEKYYPDVPIFIGDNGDDTPEKQKFFNGRKNCTYIILPFDLGVAGVRNEAIKRIPRSYKYLFIAEDDIVFDGGFKLETLKAILDHDSEIGIVGGYLKTSSSQEQHYEGMYRIEGDKHYMEKINSPKWNGLGDVKYCLCDFILNVFLMRLDVWHTGFKWDPQFKTALEHADFFMNLKYTIINKRPVQRKKAWKVAYTPDAWLWHLQGATTERYEGFRSRPVGFRLFGQKWGLRECWSDYNLAQPLYYETHRQVNFLKHTDSILIPHTWDCFDEKHLHLILKGREVTDGVTLGVLNDEAVRKFGVDCKESFEERHNTISSLPFVDSVIELTDGGLARDIQRMQVKPRYIVPFLKADKQALQDFFSVMGIGVIDL